MNLAKQIVYFATKALSREAARSKMLLFASLATLLVSCGSDKKQIADFIVTNAKVYTVDPSFTVLESFAVKDDKIIAVGTNASIAATYSSDSIVNMQGKIILPGLIDAHCHFYGYAKGLRECNLVGTKSFEEVIARVKEFSKTNKRTWIIGRGWDQNDWVIKVYPDRKMLDSLFPNTPVVLKRIDGHAALVNTAAMRAAGITDSTKISGGEILRELIPLPGRRNSELKMFGPATGILIDNAVDLVDRVVPPMDEKQIRECVLEAQNNCFAVGLTTLDDAGLMKEDIDVLSSMETSGELNMRLYIMLSDSSPNYAYYLTKGPTKTPHINVRSFKFYGDGALGSRGAMLLQPYSDMPGHRGFLLRSPEHYKEKFALLQSKGFQVCTHCIGDSANRLILRMYGELLPEGNDSRWRIEHAQVVHPADRAYFKKYAIIPSVQPTHATSDMYWVEKRLGETRLPGAYAYKSLLDECGILALGTDFPVENISPWNTMYAAVARKDLKGFPDGGFMPNEILERKQAIFGMTSWAAFSNF
ncbi:MAG TPA: amidohydrolase family protein, partial [Bacteroidia bacterium]|nr:amidohydrolase family protein [Bacteroidia bacterium]